MKVIISGGGTGGHLYPALAIGRVFREKGAEILYIGSHYGIEKNIMPNEEFRYKLLPVKALRNKNIFVLTKNAYLVLKSFQMAKKIVADFKPDLIIGTGGYASFPVLRAGAKLGVKTMLHEANAEMGRANQELASLADCLCLTYPDTAKYVKNAKKILLTGMPVRDSIKTATREDGANYVGINDDTLLVTVTGGSQGAHHINLAMADFYKNYQEKKKVLFYHIVGKMNKDDVSLIQYPFVRVKEYEQQMDLVLARTDICIGRAGASFLAEIAVKGVPTILVPYPFSNGHQEKNAAYYDLKGAAKMVLDGDMKDKLSPALNQLIEDEAYRHEMKEHMHREAKGDALQRIVEAGLSLIKE
jgi:UDP-N-acetylglucosamine--N-acetylmuramyl-(pentapeptide) pyrophosphoryl-undecaprenol N-acetylglucosamine transferase